MRHSLYILVGGFLTGVLWRSFFAIGVPGMVALMLGILLVSVVMRRRFHAGLYLTLFACALLMGIVRTEFAYQAYESDRREVAPGFIQTEGQVTAEPDRRDGYTILVLALLDAEGGETHTQVRAKVPPFPVFAYGDRVSLSGDLTVPRAFETETGRVFDYPGYLMKEGIHYELKNPVVTETGIHSGSRIQSWLLSTKHAWLESVSRLIPEPGAALAGGLVVGAKQSLGEHWLELFRITGIIHIVVLSGYNLSLIANTIVRACRVLPRLTGLTFGIVGVVGFALMAGASATVVRASIMAILAMLAVHVQRPHAIPRLLTIAAFAMVFTNPFVLVFDAGFQLSFLATIGLVVYAPRFEGWFRRVPEAWQLRSIVSATCATQLTVLPLLLYQVGQASLVAPLVNVLVLPVVPLIMALTFVAGTLGVVSSTIAVPFAWPAHILLSYIFSVVDIFSRVPFAAVSPPSVSAWFVVLLYATLALYTVTHKHRAKRAR